MEYTKSMRRNLGSKERELSRNAEVEQKKMTKSFMPNMNDKNRGLSYLVAPLNVTSDPKIQRINQSNQQKLENYNKKYFSAHTKELRKNFGGSVNDSVPYENLLM